MSFRFWMMEDETARAWQPFALTRPAGELLFGTETLRARCERVLGRRCEGYAGCPSLAGFEEPGAPSCADSSEEGGVLAGPGEHVRPSGDAPDPASTPAATLFLSSRFVPAETAFQADRANGFGSAPAVLQTGGELAGVWLPAGMAPTRNQLASPPAQWQSVPVEGDMLDSAWRLMARNAERISADADRFPDHGPPRGAHRIGEHPISVGDGAVVEPGVVLDASAGPILLDAGARVRAFSRIAGPAYVGPGSMVLGGSLERTSAGPGCKLGGEVSASVLLGFANKVHHGFLGHSVVGRWANLGAATTNSNLKNTYGPVRFQAGGEVRETGLTKAGCLLGDHVRTGIGTLLDTGTVVGAGSNVFGGVMTPKWVPPFSWAGGAPAGVREYDIDRFLATAAKVMARRGVALSEGMRRLYRRAFAATRLQRHG